MKKLLIVFFLLVMNFAVRAQYPIQQNLGSDSTVIYIKGAARTVGGFINGVYTDTAAANQTRIRQYQAAQIFTLNDSAIWFRMPGATKWVRFMPATPPSPNVDTSYWSLSGNYVADRVATPKLGTTTGHEFNIITNDSIRLTIPVYGIKRVTGNQNRYLVIDTTIGSNMYVGYMDGGSGSSYTAGNGLTLSGSQFKLGGTLTENTTIDGDTYNFSIQNVEQSSIIANDEVTISSITGSSIRQFIASNTYSGLISQNGSGRVSSSLVYYDSIVLNPGLGNLKIDSLNYTLSTTGKKIMLRDTATGLVQNIDPSLIVGATPTLQQVLTAGSTLTASNIIDVNNEDLDIVNGSTINIQGASVALTNNKSQFTVEDSIRMFPYQGIANIDSLRTWSGISDTTHKKPMTWDTRNGRWEYAANWYGGGGSVNPKYFNILISGQSNAWGASGPTAHDTARNSRVLVWNHAQTTPGWVTATINQRPFRTAGYNSVNGGGLRDDLNGSSNSAFYLAKKLADENPNDTIRIIMAIGDGQPISGWFNGTTKGQYTDSITTRGDAALVGQKVDLFIWCQGESDGATAEATYIAAFDSIKATLRRKDWFPLTTPIVVSGLPVMSGTATFKAKDTTLQKMDYDSDVWSGYGLTTGLTIANDDVHYSAGSLDTLGSVRYYQTWKALPYRNIEKSNSLAGGTTNNNTTNNYYSGDSLFYHFITVGKGRDADTLEFSPANIYDAFYTGEDSLILTKVRAVIQGTSDTIGIQILYNDTLNVNGTSITSSTVALNNGYTGTEVTSFSNGRIPNNNWVWLTTPTLEDGRVPKLLSVSIYGYLKDTTTLPDADATAFIDSAGITDETQIDAIRTLVRELKDSSLWSSMYAIYPMVGGTASTHKWNLKDPRNLDAAYRISFNGTWTHSSSGADPDGSTAYGNTYVNSSTTLGNYDRHFSVYYTQSSASNGWEGLFNGSIVFGIQMQGALYNGIGHGLNTLAENNASNAGASGFFVGSVNGSGSNQGTIYKNGSSVFSVTPGSLTTSLNYYIGALNSSGSAALYNNRNIAFYTLGPKLTSDQARALNTIVEKFEDALGRGVQ